MIIPDTRQRLEAAYQDLEELLVGCCSAPCTMLWCMTCLIVMLRAGLKRAHYTAQAYSDEELKQSPEGTAAQEAVSELAAVVEGG